MRAVNLLPKEAIRERPALANMLPTLGAAGVPLIAVILVVAGYTGAHSAVAEKRGQLEVLRLQIPATVPATATTPAPDTSGLVSVRSQRLTALQNALGKQVAWDTTLREVARVLPANVWLTDLTVTAPSPADATAPAAPSSTASGFTIDGYTYSETDVAALLERLQLLPTLTNVTLVSTAQTNMGTKSLVQFQITAGVQTTPTVSPT